MDASPCSSAAGAGVAELVGRQVRHHGVGLGRVTDVFLHPDGERPLGLEIETGDGTRMFLPWSAWEERDGEVEVAIPLVLLSEGELDFYDRRARRFSATPALAVSEA